MFLILVASNAMDGTYLDYRPPTFQVWERGVWERGTWGMNDDWDPAGGGGGGGGGTRVTQRLFGRRRIAVP
jgi:hypothetical protein